MLFRSVETPLELMMDGGSLNPVVLNKTTGEFIRLAKALQPADRLYINTDPEHLEVSLITMDPLTNREERSNAYGYLSGDSAMLRLAPGLNELVFTSDDENKRVKLTLSFYKRYIGV